MIDPHIAALMHAMADGGFALPDPLEAASLRTMLDAPIPALPVAVAERRDVQIEGDGRIVLARLYHPRPSKILPIVLFFHGGGWVHGTLGTHDRLAARLAVEAECAVLSVDYRLAPEHPFPAALEDAMLALQWVKQHHAAIGGDADRIAVAGDSAGGNIAAALAHAAAGDPAMVHQLLFYPVLDGRCSTASYEAGHAAFLSAAQMRWYWDQYAPGDSRRDPRASVAEAAIPAGLAPATIITAGYDPLHDEGVAYADALTKAGVAVTLHDYSAAIHGFASLIGMAAIADEALAKGCEALKRAFGNATR